MVFVPLQTLKTFSKVKYSFHGTKDLKPYRLWVIRDGGSVFDLHNRNKGVIGPTIDLENMSLGQTQFPWHYGIETYRVRVIKDGTSEFDLENRELR